VGVSLQPPDYAAVSVAVAKIAIMIMVHMATLGMMQYTGQYNHAKLITSGDMGMIPSHEMLCILMSNPFVILWLHGKSHGHGMSWAHAQKPSFAVLLLQYNAVQLAANRHPP